MKLTNELKAKFFALYWGQRVINHKEVNRLYRVVNLLELKNDVWEAHLKPLSAITDEDAIEAARCYFRDREFTPSSEWEHDLKAGANHIITDRDVADFLRWRGYALPFFGISVEQQVEAGWIKLIE